jgi:sulfhydrogenase subunit gamma (sulfur reductase)
MKSNPYLPALAGIQGVTEESPEIRTFTVALREEAPFDPEPGQFIEFSLFGYGEFPVSIAGVADAGRGIFQVTIRRSGGVTERIKELKVGSTVGIRGPFGKGYPLEKLAGKDVILAAGGIGMASIKYLADRLLMERDRFGRVILLYGALTPANLLYRNVPAFFPRDGKGVELESFVTVNRPDADWKGHVGNVTDLLHAIEPGVDAANAMVAACGPSRMMKAVVDRFAAAGFTEEQMLLSFERRMQCGIGVCGHCMCGEKLICQDGPVMSVRDVRETLEKIF